VLPVGPTVARFPVSSVGFGPVRTVKYVLLRRYVFLPRSQDDGTLLYSTALPYDAGGTGIAGDSNGDVVFSVPHDTTNPTFRNQWSTSSGI